MLCVSLSIPMPFIRRFPFDLRAAKRLEEAAAAEKAKADAALAAAASSSDDSDDSDSDSSDSDSDGGGQQKAAAASGKKAPPVTKLPSALDLLETVEAPAFLSVPAGNRAEFDVPPMKATERYVRLHVCVHASSGW